MRYASTFTLHGLLSCAEARTSLHDCQPAMDLSLSADFATLFLASLSLSLLPMQAHVRFYFLLNPLTPVPPVTAGDEPWPFFRS